MNRLLALTLLKEQEKIDSILQLTSAGFTQKEIASLLGVTQKAIELSLYRHKKTKQKIIVKKTKSK
jgi:predicted transcriptional regulator